MGGGGGKSGKAREGKEVVSGNVQRWQLVKGLVRHHPNRTE